ncbi:ABC transporter substrate-binding protein [Kordiimonas sp.]|uniref:ABC transporter substrate-binding protein n=1 Tax=Kordiimonas sp. TaxID=1970157 RepID=UPI003A94EA1A
MRGAMSPTLKKLFSVSLLAVAGVQHAAAEPDGWRDGDVLRLALPSPLNTVDPALHLHQPDKVTIEHVSEALVALKADMTVGAGLAESFRVSSDGLQYTFVLRPNVTFHNGEKLTADTVEWVWENYYLKPEVEWHCLARFDERADDRHDRTLGGNIKAIDALDDRTVRFTLAEPSSAFLYRMADVSCPAVIFHPDSIGENGRVDNLIGTGPYKFDGVAENGVVTLKRFDGYQGLKGKRDGYSGARVAKVARVELVPVKNERDAVSRFLAGEIDILGEISAATYMGLKAEETPKLYSHAMTSWWALLLQTADPVLDDVRVRKAIAHAIDAKRIADVVSNGRVAANPSVVPVFSAYTSKTHKEGWDYNPALARKLLAEAGYNGEQVTLHASADPYPEMMENAVLINSMLNAVGINATLEPMSWDSQLNAKYRKGAFQLSSFGYGGRDYPTFVYGKFLGPKSVKPIMQWESPDMEALVDSTLGQRTVKELSATYAKIHTRMLADVPMIPLFPFELRGASAPTVKGFELWAHNRPRLWGVTKDAGK